MSYLGWFLRHFCGVRWVSGEKGEGLAEAHNSYSVKPQGTISGVVPCPNPRRARPLPRCELPYSPPLGQHFRLLQYRLGGHFLLVRWVSVLAEDAAH